MTGFPHTSGGRAARRRPTAHDSGPGRGVHSAISAPGAGRRLNSGSGACWASAKVNFSLAAIWVMPVIPLTSTGAVLDDVVPSPSWPRSLSPQASTRPPLSATLNFSPADTMLAFATPTGWGLMAQGAELHVCGAG